MSNHTQLGDDVFLVYWGILNWEDQNQENLFTSFSENEESIYLLMRIALAVRNGNPPNKLTQSRDWVLFILNEFIEFAADFSINNIKSVIQNPDRQNIADDIEARLLQDPSTWSLSAFRNVQQNVNILLRMFEPDDFGG